MTMLCEKCQHITFQPLSGTAFGEPSRSARHNPLACFGHSPSIQMLQKSAEGGCRFCNRLLYAFQDWELVKIQAGPMRPVWITVEKDPQEEGMHLLKVFCGKRSASIYLKDPSRASMYIRESSPNSDTGSKSVIDLASRWIQNCISNHARCRAPAGPLSRLPTRVIDVGSTSQPPFLFTSNGVRGQYLALSHCWGKIRILTTRSDNIQQHSKEISMAALSKTFQDAVILTRQLGVKYLWIDSLCIVQDSREDWELESIVMNDYYKNAYLTIAASYAQDGSVGCFQTRNALAIEPCWIKFAFAPSTLGPNSINEEHIYIAHQFSQKNLSFHEAEWKLPVLDQRAWCMQEMVLSTRVLKFDKATVRWICNEEVASEGAPWGDTRSSAVDEEGLETMNPNSQILLHDFKNHSSEALHSIWLFKIVALYTQRRLTVASDLLPALAAVAKEMNALLNEDKYLAGLWYKDLQRELLWQPSDTRDEGKGVSEPVTRSFHYRAPTWSWASVNASAIYYEDDFIFSAEPFRPLNIFSANVTPSGRNPFGEVEEGALHLEGVLKAGNLTPMEELPDHFNIQDINTGNHFGRLHADLANFSSRQIFCLPVRYSWETKKTIGLGLAPTGQNPGEFYRVGVFTANGTGWFDGSTVQDISIL